MVWAALKVSSSYDQDTKNRIVDSTETFLGKRLNYNLETEENIELVKADYRSFDTGFKNSVLSHSSFTG